jgi:hypothetical protein
MINYIFYKKPITFAILAHVSTMIMAVMLFFMPIIKESTIITNVEGFEQIIITNKTIFESEESGSILTLLFPWIITGVSLFSLLMSNTSNYNKTIKWRWRSYTWATGLIMIVFLLLSWKSGIGIFYLPTTILIIISGILRE